MCVCYIILKACVEGLEILREGFGIISAQLNSCVLYLRIRTVFNYPSFIFFFF